MATPVTKIAKPQPWWCSVCRKYEGECQCPKCDGCGASLWSDRPCPARDEQQDGHAPRATEPATNEPLLARFHHALDIINALVPLVPPTAFAWPPAQEALSNAQALLVEEGRVVASDEARAVAVEKWLGDERRK